MLVRDANIIPHQKGMDNTILSELIDPDLVKNSKMNCSIAHAIVRPGESNLPHRLKESAEIYYIICGKGLMHVNEECQEVGPNQAIYAPPMSTLFIENPGETDLIFLAINDPRWREEDEELVNYVP